MKKLILIAALLGASACVPYVDAGGGLSGSAGLPTHPDPLCFYTEPFEPGGPLGEVCA